MPVVRQVSGTSSKAIRKERCCNRMPLTRRPPARPIGQFSTKSSDADVEGILVCEILSTSNGKAPTRGEKLFPTSFAFLSAVSAMDDRMSNGRHRKVKG